MKKIYIAGPLGFSEACRDFYYGRLLPIVKESGFEVLDPWDTEIEIPSPEAQRNVWDHFNMLVGERNRKAIESSDGMFAVLDGTDVDSGTASEIGYAFALGKKILGYRGDFRLTGDNPGSTVNLQVEYFIRKSGGRIVRSAEELSDALADVFTD